MCLTSQDIKTGSPKEKTAARPPPFSSLHSEKSKSEVENLVDTSSWILKESVRTMPDNPNSSLKYFHYDPSLAAAVIFVILFLSTTAWHTLQLCRTRAWIMIPLVVGGYCTYLNINEKLAIDRYS